MKCLRASLACATRARTRANAVLLKTCDYAYYGFLRDPVFSVLLVLVLLPVLVLVLVPVPVPPQPLPSHAPHGGA